MPLRSGNPNAAISLLAAAVNCSAVGTPVMVVAAATPTAQNNSTLAMANAINNFTLIFNTLHY
jgi:hypothetical protein